MKKKTDNRKNTDRFTDDGTIDFEKIYESDEGEKKQNVFKALFKNRKAFDVHTETDEHRTVDPEAKKLSDRFSVAYNILWVVLIVFIVVFLAFFSDGITTESMQHTFRNMFGRADSTSAVSDYYFSVNENAAFSEFSGVPVVAGSDRVIIFSPDGSHEYSEESNYNRPAVLTSDRYILIYDKNGNGYGIYDSFGMRHSESKGARIYAAALADDGSYVIARGGSDYTSEITIYTSTFETLNLIKKNNRVAGLDIKSDGREIMLLTYSVKADGSVESELMLLSKRETAPRKLLTFNEGMPLDCRYIGDGKMLLLFERSMFILSKDGERIASCALDTDGMYMYKLSQNGELAYYTQSHESSEIFTLHTIRLGEDGMKRGEYTFTGKVTDLNIHGDYVYIITEDRVIRTELFGFDNVKEYTLGQKEKNKKIYSLIAISDKEYVCLSDTVSEISFGK